MPTAPATPTDHHAAVNRLVPFVHVADVGASLAFYRHLGFTPRSTLHEPEGRPFWALAKSHAAEIILAQASRPIDADQQAILLYMYTPDVAALRRRLLAHAVRDAGQYSGAAAPDDAPISAFTIAHPRHMPAGEMRVIDPDGYVILVGQLG